LAIKFVTTALAVAGGASAATTEEGSTFNPSTTF
jgi:uncharacterized protein (DUF697 family)